MGPPLPQGATESQWLGPSTSADTRTRSGYTRVPVCISIGAGEGEKKKNRPPCVIQLPELVASGWSARSRRPSARICPARSCPGLARRRAGMHRSWRSPRRLGLAQPISPALCVAGRHSRRAISGSFTLSLAGVTHLPAVSRWWWGLYSKRQ